MNLAITTTKPVRRIKQYCGKRHPVFLIGNELNRLVKGIPFTSSTPPKIIYQFLGMLSRPSLEYLCVTALRRS